MEKCLKLLTFLPLEEISELCAYTDERINVAKRRLAFEVCSIVHGREEAIKAQNAAEAVFGVGNLDNMPTMELLRSQTGDNLKVVDALSLAQMVKSKSEARRLIEGGGISVNETKVQSVDDCIPAQAMQEGQFILHKGKKAHLRIILK